MKTPRFLQKPSRGNTRTAIFIAAVLTVGLLLVVSPYFLFYYGAARDQENTKYWAYANFIASYSYVRAQEPESPCRDPEMFLREYLKHCNFIAIKNDEALGRILFPQIFSRKMTVSILKPFPGAREVLARDFDRRCELLKEFDWRVQAVVSYDVKHDDCRLGAFVIEQKADSLTLWVVGNVLSHN